jgi:hypothetical protein
MEKLRADNNLAPDHLRGLMRHFADLRDGTHGNGAVSRVEKELLFNAALGYLDPYARQALAEMNATLLLGSGTVSATGVTRSANGDCTALWTLVWQEQQQSGIPPVTLGGLFRPFLPPPAPARRHRGGLAAERLQHRRRSGRAADLAGDCECGFA